MTGIEDLDFTPVVACEALNHDLGYDGCVPGTSATHYVHVTHVLGYCKQGVPVPQVIPVCTGRAAHIRGVANETVICPSCRTQFAFEQFCRVIGPIHEKETHA